MVLSNTGDNKFGFTPFIVGKTLGDGCNYAGGAGIQQAIDDCFALGGGNVAIRFSSSGYSVNLNLRSNVNLIGYGADASTTSGTYIFISGSHTWADPSGNSVGIYCENIYFLDSTGAGAIIVSPTNGTSPTLTLKACSVISDNSGSGQSIVINPDSSCFVTLYLFETGIFGGTNAVNCTGQGFVQIFVYRGSILDSSEGACISNGASMQYNALQVQYSQVEGATAAIEDLAGTLQATVEFSYFLGSTIFAFTASGGSVTSDHCLFDASGSFYATGTGSFSHAGSIFQGATNAAGSVSVSKQNWQPYAESGTMGSAYAGTSSYDNTQFIVTGGFVRINPSIITPVLPFTEVVTPTQTMVVNNGYVSNDGASLVTFTLPATAAFGTVLAVVGKGSGLFTIAQNAGQVIHFGDFDTSVGVSGSLSSNKQYCVVYLLCTTADTEFTVTDSISNFTLV